MRVKIPYLPQVDIENCPACHTMHHSVFPTVLTAGVYQYHCPGTSSFVTFILQPVTP